MLSITATQEWSVKYPGATIGLLEVSQIDNKLKSSQLDHQKRAAEQLLREKYQGFTRADFLSLPVMSVYDRYYRSFDKTYHVLQQVESIALKAKNLPDVSPLVDSNFIAEVETLVLTAGHDADKLQGEIFMDVAREGEQMAQMKGALKTVLMADMLMRDQHGVCCSIIYGQDNLSLITTETTKALYVAYAPAGVLPDLVMGQLNRILANIKLFCPKVVVEQQRLLLA